MATILETAAKILKTGYVCDSCLGRQFGQLLSGYTNAERGKAVRLLIASALDAGEEIDIAKENVAAFSFRHQKIKPAAPKACWVCGSLFTKLDSLAARATRALAPYGFHTFLVGIKQSKQLAQAEEKLWEAAGIEWVEQVKAELSREIGKRIEVMTGKRAELKNPDIAILFDMVENKILLQVNPLFIYGRYKKFILLPQTRWPCRECRGKGCERCDFTGKMYPSSVEERIGKKILQKTGGKSTAFHGAGREDIDVKCLDWREFVIEIAEPKVRDCDFKKLTAAINSSNRGKIAVSALRPSSKEEVRRVKSERRDKTYRVVASFERPLAKKELAKLKRLVGTINQKTPRRVIHRRADIVRKRRVKSLSYKLLGKKRLRLDIRGEAGLYVKELVTGDEGRTSPAAAEVLGAKPKIQSVAVIKIW